MQLTQSQLLLWAGQKLNPDTPLHNTAHSFDISGDIDFNIFSKAFQETIARTDALRTVFFEENGIPQQRIVPSIAFTPEYIDLSGEEDENAIQLILKERSKAHIAISERIFDAALFKINENRYIWFLNMHHMVTDAISATLVYKRVALLYKTIAEGSLAALSAFPTFSEYVAFESKQLNHEDLQDTVTYWNTKIQDLKEISNFYGIRTKDVGTTSTRVTLKFGTERADKLRALIQQPELRSWTSNLTLFNIFATVYFVYLHRISGEKKIAIGAPAHNRLNKKIQETIGLFIEIFPVVSSLSEEDTFRTVLERMKLEANDYLRHAQPGMVTPEISGSFNTILNYINATFSDFNGIPMKSEWIHTDHIDITHQMRCHIVDFDDTGDIEVMFDLNHGVFNAELIERVPQHFLNVFDAFLEDMDQSIYQPSIITPEELQAGLTETQTEANDFVPIIAQFQKQCEADASLNAVQFREEKISYGLLDQKSDALAVFLKNKGVVPGDKVALYLERSPEYLIGALAILKLGGTFIPIPSDQPDHRITYILEDSGSSLLLTTSNLIGNIDTGNAESILWNELRDEIEKIAEKPRYHATTAEDIAYMIYTSGSTGNPKGVLISNGAFFNYIAWAQHAYKNTEKYIFPLFTSIGFDLTITSTFLPLTTGGEIVVYKESDHGPDISLMEVLEENKVNSIKLTPSHLALIQGRTVSDSKLRTMIVGGEDFKTHIANAIQTSFGPTLKIYNEYGPTEATVGCIVSQYDANKHLQASVPIGNPIAGMQAYVLDSHKNMVPTGVIGELYMGGLGLANGYANLPDLVQEKFVDNPFVKGTKMYHTGDLVRMNEAGEYEYLGRADEQIKLRGFRIELPDIESNLANHELVDNCAVVLIESKQSIPEDEVFNCVRCGLPSNFPNTDFDEEGVCHVCNAFDEYEERAQRYFKTLDDLKAILMADDLDPEREYDCLSLLSGGKDSTYILAQLKRMGLKVLAFTLDNGYISTQAKDNIDNIVSKMGIDHVYGTTEHMNKIFVDSLHRFKNVCDGCFKTIYTLSTKIALEKKIPFVVTGLSRGQFFETRLTEELFRDKDADASQIDDTILEARKLYHQEEDAVKTLLDTSDFEDDSTFEKVQFVDFFRYTDVSLEEMIRDLEDEIGWRRPTDTGRSTNCLINQVGIYVHKKQKGYSNYSFPYSWDVRMGHKTRQETLDEINEYIYEDEVKRIMKEIGYEEPGETELNQQRLVGYYTGDSRVPSKELAEHLRNELPEYMVPTHFKYVEELPLTSNGKVDKATLKRLNLTQLDLDTPFVAPEGEIEELLAAIWKEVLRLDQVGTQDDFIALGGHSLAAIRVTARINEEFEMNLPLNKIFELPTIGEYAAHIEATIIALMEE
ncbi:amino acid adenylation domain-containing protein [Spongiimicrobium salis]|uniref:amino acid adenylation domain-containing protein n=1 Tax=Spongiimicrobium salis TaxID=1667022 RepID=UPI00374D6D10